MQDLNLVATGNFVAEERFDQAHKTWKKSYTLDTVKMHVNKGFGVILVPAVHVLLREHVSHSCAYNLISRNVSVFRQDPLHACANLLVSPWCACTGRPAILGTSGLCRCIFIAALTCLTVVKRHFVFCRFNATNVSYRRLSQKSLLFTGVFTDHALTFSSRLNPTLCNFVHFA